MRTDILTALPRSFRGLFLIEPHVVGAERVDTIAVVGVAGLYPGIDGVTAT